MTGDQILQLMADTLLAFERREIALGSLIADLEGLLKALDPIEEDWREAFWDSWGELEMSYALAIHRSPEPMDQASERLVWEAVANLKLLVAAKLKQSN
jgi:hypothetical protein